MVAQRVRAIEISGIRKMFEGAPPSAINLGLGEPDFDPPKAVIEALCTAVRTGQNHYGPSAGLSDLREAVAGRYRDRLPETSREHVIITASGSEALMAVALALYDPGDEVLVPNPGFVLYAPHARIAGAVPIPYPLVESAEWAPDLDRLESLVTPKTRAIVVNSPSNPTGAVLNAKAVERIIEFADRHALYIVSDEAYEQIVYDGPATSFWGRGDRVVVVNTFSKTFAMTGWRLGFLLAAPPLAIAINKIHYHILACPPTPTQIAVLAGFEKGGPTLRSMLREFRTRRDLVVRELGRIRGVSFVVPRGAFYVFPKFHWKGTSLEVATALLRRGVISTPGDAFGSLGASHLRFSFAASRIHLRQGLARFKDVAEAMRG
ncbi:MAG: pyridoxal phosphate-dependent aminotransferase [Thermoplasmata archaeon]